MASVSRIWNGATMLAAVYVIFDVIFRPENIHQFWYRFYAICVSVEVFRLAKKDFIANKWQSNETR